MRSIFLTFDVERDYTRNGYVNPRTFTGINHHIPRILDLMKSQGIIGTFFLTSEVITENEALVKEIDARHILGIHLHPYVHDEFKGSDDFANYSRTRKAEMVAKEVETWMHYGLTSPAPFRIGQLKPDWDVLRMIRQCSADDSSFQISDFGFGNRLKVGLMRLREHPVTTWLYRWTPHDFQKHNSLVVLVHPNTPTNRNDIQVYDESILTRILAMSRIEYEYKVIGL